jgi:hypothetical protein
MRTLAHPPSPSRRAPHRSLQPDTSAAIRESARGPMDTRRARATEFAAQPTSRTTRPPIPFRPRQLPSRACARAHSCPPDHAVSVGLLRSACVELFDMETQRCLPLLRDRTIYSPLPRVTRANPHDDANGSRLNAMSHLGLLRSELSREFGCGST